MKTLACISGLLLMLLLSKATQHVRSFSLSPLAAGGQKASAAQRFTDGRLAHLAIADQRSSCRRSSSRCISSRLFGYNAEEEEYEIKRDTSSSSPKAWSADVLLPFLPSADSHGQWTLRNDFYSFLNQCSIQSFLFLLKSLRDPYTLLYLENYTQSIIESDHGPSRSSFGLRGGIADRSKLLNYHGLAAMNTTLFPTWNSYFLQLLEKPIETYIIESSHLDYEMEIQPSSLCSRLLAIRQQIGAEFAKDLSVIAEMGGHTLESYWDSLKELHEQEKMTRRKQDSKNDDEKPATGIDSAQQQHHDKNNHNFDVKRHNHMCFLELPADTSSGHSPSPLRRGNFDLLNLLTIQEALHRVLNGQQDEYGEQSSSSTATTASIALPRASKLYLTEFYMSRIPSHFAGNQRYGQADAFMAELLAEVPTLKLSSSSVDKDNDDKGKKKKDSGTAAVNSLNLIDPTHIAQVVMEKRREVALEWEQMARLVPDRHLEIKRLQLTMQMMGGHFSSSSSSSSSGDSSNSDSPPSSSSGAETKMVSFEEALRAKSRDDGGTCATVAAMAAARAAATAAAVPFVEPPAVQNENERTTTPTRKSPYTTVPTRRKQADFARSIQERKMGIAARARVSAASMAVPDRTSRGRVMSSDTPAVPADPPPKLRAMAGVGFGKEQNSSRAATMVKADAAASVSMPRRQRRKQQRTSISRSTSVKQNSKAPPPPVAISLVVKDAFVSNIKEMREKAASSSPPVVATPPGAFKDNNKQQNTWSPLPTRVIRLKNFNNHNNNNNKRSGNDNKKSPQLAAAAAHLPFNRTSIFE